MVKSKLSWEKAIQHVGIKELNALQKSVLECAAKSRNIQIISPTGSGKTLSFLLPVLSLLSDEEHVQVLIIAPSRELAIQIEEVFKSLKTGIRSLCCYGGHPFSAERNSLKNNPQVIVGTPGRLADHIRRETLQLKNLSALVIDEFDKALELGFEKEMNQIYECTPRHKRVFLTSATKMNELPRFIDLKDVEVVDFSKKQEAVQSSRLTTWKVLAEGEDKLSKLVDLLCWFKGEPTLVFCNHREAVERIGGKLNFRGISHGIFHGGLEQEDRERALIKFRNGSHQLLLTTDLASRGLDIPMIKHVVHYQLPGAEEVYIHRSGRTARMDATGNTYLLLGESDYVPPYLTVEPKELDLPFEPDLPSLPEWETLYIGGGKKDKISKVDLVGFFCQKGGLDKADLGKIELRDKMAYIAIKRDKVSTVLKKVKGHRLKRKLLKIAVSK